MRAGSNFYLLCLHPLVYLHRKTTIQIEYFLSHSSTISSTIYHLLPSHSSTILKWRFSHFFNLLQDFGPWIDLHLETLTVPYWLQRELKFGPVRKCSAIQIVLLCSQHGWLHGISSQHYCSLLIPWLIIWQKNHPKISTVMYIPPPDPQQDYGRRKSIVSPLVSKGKT